MPKRYKVQFRPKANTEPTSTAIFEKAEDDPQDHCADRPQDEAVSKHHRKRLEEDGAAKNRDRWTCAEIKDLLGVTLREKHQ